MKILKTALTTVLFCPLISLAQEPVFDETLLVLTTSDGERYEDVAEGCSWAVPYMPTEIINGVVYSLRGVVTKNEEGELSSTDGDRVGEMWLCIGDLEEGQDPNFMNPDEPPYKRTLTFYLEIDGRAYGALGEWSQKTEYYGLSQESALAVWGGAARIVHIVDGLPAGLAGAMTYNLTDSQTGGYRPLIMSLRLYEDRVEDEDEPEDESDGWWNRL